MAGSVPSHLLTFLAGRPYLVQPRTSFENYEYVVRVPLIPALDHLRLKTLTPAHMQARPLAFTPLHPWRDVRNPSTVY